MSEILAAGNYKAVATPVEGAYAQLGMSLAGNQQVLVQFKILEGPAMGRTIPWWGSFTDKSWTRTMEALRYCGFKGDDLYELPGQALDQEVGIVVEHSEYQGKTNARVRWVNAPSSGVKLAKPMDQNQLRNFSAMMKAKVAQVKAVEGKKASVSEAPAFETPPPSDEDDPFA
jgi:hypothetical protein